MHRHICLNIKGWYDAICFMYPVVCNSQHEPFVICLLYIVRGHPCLWALSFGEDVGGKSNVRRSGSTSLGMRIKQCVHIVLCLALSPQLLTQKKRGIVLLPIPRVEALALPIIVEQTTSEPTPIWKSVPLRDLYNTFDWITKGYNLCFKGLHGDW